MTNYSKQKDAIMSVLMSTKSHPTAEWVYEKVQDIIPNVSLGTVYRNLGKMVKNGEIIKVQGVFEKDRYDGNNHRHSHLVCLDCGAVVDFDIPKKLDDEILSFGGEGTETFSLTYEGLCDTCKAKKAQLKASV